MSAEDLCHSTQLQLSSRHDAGAKISEETRDHLACCDECSEFARRLSDLDAMLARGVFDRYPDVTDRVMSRVSPFRARWWAVAAVALIGIVAGSLVGGLGSRLDMVQAQDLDDLFHSASPFLDGLQAGVVVVERGWHPEVPQRVYTGSLEYAAPEQISITLVDTTEYPDGPWVPNDLTLVIDDGDMVTTATSPCPLAALPECLNPPTTREVRDQVPFDAGVLAPLEIVGPERSLVWSSGIDVIGSPTLRGRSTIQVRTTVAAVELIGAMTGQGSWRELHPTDIVLMWLDEQTLVPLRVEVTAADSQERELWQLRHGYTDDSVDDPILIIELRDVTAYQPTIDVDVDPGAPSGGFMDGPVGVPQPDLDEGFTTHRTGTWALPDGGLVQVSTWSDGRSWLMVETTDGWGEPHLFGIGSPFVRQVDLEDGSIGYLDPAGSSIAIHSIDRDLLVRGSVSEESLIDSAGSLGIRGMSVPQSWIEASVVDVAALPRGTLVAHVEGWSILGRVDGDVITTLLTGGGTRTVFITQEPGRRLDAPTGPDFSAVDVRGRTGRFDLAAATLEWVEDGYVIRVRSDSVGLAEMVGLAESMRAS